MTERQGSASRKTRSLRDDGRIGDAAFRRVEEELDREELGRARLDLTGQERRDE